MSGKRNRSIKNKKKKKTAGEVYCEFIGIRTSFDFTNSTIPREIRCKFMPFFRAREAAGGCCMSGCCKDKAKQKEPEAPPKCCADRK